MNIKGNFVIQTITNSILYGKESLENKIPQKGLGVVSEEGLRHEYDCPAS